MDIQKNRSLLYEFMRYVPVGGISFLADTGTMTLIKEQFFRQACTPIQMALCVSAGFAVGLLVNYLLSCVFVFRTGQQRQQSRKWSAFLIYAAVGIVGFGLTQLGMWIGVKIVGSDGLWYVLVKCFVAGLVLIWNYAGRKILVYHGK
jgi:putative flippase GtrA